MDVGRLHGTNGAAAELLVCVDLMRSGYHVYRAVSPATPSDLVAISDEETLRVEVRCATERKDGSLSPVMRQTDECDLYAFVCGTRIEYMKPEEANAAIQLRRSWRAA